VCDEKTPDNLLRKLHQTIKKVSEDIEDLKFNTMVASLMEFINDWQKSCLSKQDASLFARILAPCAPHFSEEIWCEVLKNKFSIHQQEWPKYDDSLIVEEIATVIIQVNGRVRGEARMRDQDSKIEAMVQGLAKKDPRVIKYLEGKEIKKTIFVSGKLVNFVTG
jgi:leucyl-tRNA synthetase